MGVTKIWGNRQAALLSIDVGEMSATGTPSASTYFRGDNTWATVTASQPDIPQASLVAAQNETITASYSAVVAGPYTINSGFILQINSGGFFIVV